MASLGSRSLLAWTCLLQRRRHRLQRRPSRPLSSRLRDGQCHRHPFFRGAHWHATAGVQLPLDWPAGRLHRTRLEALSKSHHFIAIAS